MALITLFSAPKPFTDPHIGTIQRNALRSWLHLPDVEILMLGDEAGMAGVAQELGIGHLPNVECNSSGTPLVSSMFALTRENSDSPLLCMVNTDILLMPEFVEAAKQIMTLKDKFVVLGRRWDLDVTEDLDFSGDWPSRLRERVRKEGQFHRPAGSDYLLFPRACYASIPDFAIGRAGWDNWMIYQAIQKKWPAVDGTPSITVIHQNHDYSHLPGGQSHHTVFETDENVRLAGGPAAVRYTILDMNFRLVNGRLVRPLLSWGRFWRGVELFLRKVLFFLPENTLENVARPKRWAKRLREFIDKQSV